MNFNFPAIDLRNPRYGSTVDLYARLATSGSIVNVEF